jgi:hypothetical protein
MRTARRAFMLAATAGVALAAAPTPAAPERNPSGQASPARDLLHGLPPAPGLSDAVMCVTVGAAPASCGPVTADVGPDGQTLVRVSDIAYRLEIYGDKLGITLFHGTMQIDGYFAPYRWSGQTLQFEDTEKATRHEVKLGTRRFDTP